MAKIESAVVVILQFISPQGKVTCKKIGNEIVVECIPPSLEVGEKQLFRLLTEREPKEGPQVLTPVPKMKNAYTVDLKLLLALKDIKLSDAVTKLRPAEFYFPYFEELVPKLRNLEAAVLEEKPEILSAKKDEQKYQTTNSNSSAIASTGEVAKTTSTEQKEIKAHQPIAPQAPAVTAPNSPLSSSNINAGVERETINILNGLFREVMQEATIQPMILKEKKRDTYVFTGTKPRTFLLELLDKPPKYAWIRAFETVKSFNKQELKIGDLAYLCLAIDKENLPDLIKVLKDMNPILMRLKPPENELNADDQRYLQRIAKQLEAALNPAQTPLPVLSTPTLTQVTPVSTAATQPPASPTPLESKEQTHLADSLKSFFAAGIIFNVPCTQYNYDNGTHTLISVVPTKSEIQEFRLQQYLNHLKRYEALQVAIENKEGGREIKITIAKMSMFLHNLTDLAFSSLAGTHGNFFQNFSRELGQAVYDFDQANQSLKAPTKLTYT